MLLQVGNTDPDPMKKVTDPAGQKPTDPES